MNHSVNSQPVASIARKHSDLSRGPNHHLVGRLKNRSPQTEPRLPPLLPTHPHPNPSNLSPKQSTHAQSNAIGYQNRRATKSYFIFVADAFALFDRSQAGWLRKNEGKKGLKINELRHGPVKVPQPGKRKQRKKKKEAKGKWTRDGF